MSYHCHKRLSNGYPQLTPAKPKMPNWGLILIVAVLSLLVLFIINAFSYPAEDSGNLPKRPIKSLRQAKSHFETSFVIDRINTNGRLSQGNYTDEQIADAIYLAEGGIKTRHPYGILTKYKHTTPHQACLNTIRSAKRRYEKTNKRLDFITFLGQTYCPIGAENDNGTNKFWVKNVKYWLVKNE